jgi:hypothetical protein
MMSVRVVLHGVKERPCDDLIPIQGILPTVQKIQKLKTAKAQQRVLQP